jgi:hypothetical protein
MVPYEKAIDLKIDKHLPFLDYSYSLDFFPGLSGEIYKKTQLHIEIV